MFETVLPEADGRRELVHRLVEHGAKGWIARGDNALQPDEEPVHERNLAGRVRYALRRGRRITVSGGLRGRSRAAALIAARRLRRLVGRIVSGPWRVLRRSSLPAAVWRPRLVYIRFMTPDGALVKFVHRGRTVARWWVDRGELETRWPWDVVVWPRVLCDHRAERPEPATGTHHDD